jgi:inner membrane protein
MHRSGHSGVSLLIYGPIGYTLLAANRPILALVGGWFAMTLASVPDIDLKTPHISHRGPTHTVAFAMLIGLILGVSGWIIGDQLSILIYRFSTLGVEIGNSEIGMFNRVTNRLCVLDSRELATFGFVIGNLSISSHLVADAITPRGIKPFWPISSRRYSFDIVKAADPRANRLFFVFGTLVFSSLFTLILLGR